MKYVKELSSTAATSAAVGALVSLPVVILLGRPFYEILEGAGVGAIIGLAASLAFRFFYLNLRGNKALGFAAIAAVIGAGTFAGAFSLGVRQALHFCLLISLAELSGLTMAVLADLRYRKMNERLKAIQEEYEDEGLTGRDDNLGQGENEPSSQGS
jgi:hypothetical protein